MEFKTTREITIENLNSILIIPEGATLYQIPNDHLGNIRDVNHYSWNGEIIAIEKDSDSVEKV